MSRILTGGAAAIAVLMILLIAGSFRQLASSRRGQGTASGSSSDFLASTNKVALARELASKGDVGSVSGLIQGLRKDPDPAVRAACAEALGRIGDKRAMPDLALRLIEDEAPAVRRAVVMAFEACGMHRDFKYYDSLRRRLFDDKAPEVRREIVQVLARLATEDALNTIATAAADEDPAVRVAVVRTFAAATNDTAGQVLSRAALDPDPQVRGEAAAALHGVGTRLLPQLREAVEKARDIPSRLAAIRMLPRPLAREAIPIVLAALEKQRPGRLPPDEKELFDRAFEALVSVGPEGVDSIAREAIREDYRGNAEFAAARACVSIGNNAAPAITRELLRWRVFPDPAELRLWIETLGELGDPCAVPVLRRALAQGLDEMTAVVAKARASIETRSGSPLAALVPEPGLLADAPSSPPARLRQGNIRFSDTVAGIPDFPSNGVVRLRLLDAMVQPDPPDHAGKTALIVDLVRRNGEWVAGFPVDADFNKRSHEGILQGSTETATHRAFVFDVLFYDDSWRFTAFGHYEVELPRNGSPFAGTYKGHTNFRPVRGATEGSAWELPPHPPTLPPLALGEHPRLLFRPADIPALRERARTDFGKRILLAMRNRIAADKALYREPLEWVTNWEPGCNLAIAHGLFALLFDDPLHGERTRKIIMDRTRTPPYGGEHGERMPGPMLHYPYAVDMNYRFLSDEERAEVIANRCWLSGLYNQENGPLAVIAANRHVFGLPGVAALTMLHERGDFALRRPVAPPSVVTLASEPGLSADPVAGPVNFFFAGSMPSNWLVAGPFPVEEGADPLAGIGGCAGAKPGIDTAVGGGKLRFRPLAASAVKSMPAPFPKMDFIELPITQGEQFFLYAILKTDARQGILIEQSSPAGARWAGLWIDGRPMSGNTVVALEPGLHRVLVAVDRSPASPTLFAANPEWAAAKNKRCEVLTRRWEQAAKRHAETGEVQDAGVAYDLLSRDIRASLMRDGLTRTGSKGGRTFPLPPSTGMSAHFLLACRAATGRGLDPDTPHPMMLSPKQFLADTRDDELIRLVGIAPENLLPEVLGEFNRRWPPDRISKLGALDLATLFTTYPCDVQPAR